LDELELIPDSLDEREICLMIAVWTETFLLRIPNVDLKKKNPFFVEKEGSSYRFEPEDNFI
jgi:hypothetical protein